VYCLELWELDVREPSEIKLYSSTTESIFPNDEIRDVDDTNFKVIMSGKISQNYEYRRYDLIIPLLRQISLNYLHIELGFEGLMNWLFISEVEVYHMYEPCKSTLLYAIYLALVFYSAYNYNYIISYGM